MEEEQKKQSIASSVGYFFFSWVPLIVFILVQVVTAVGALLLIAAIQLFPYITKVKTLTNVELLLQDIMDAYKGHIMEISLVYQIVALIIFAIWFYFYSGKKIQNPVNIFTSKSILGITVLGISVEFLINGMLSIVQVFFPKIMESYQQLLEEAGINEVSILVMLATICMAPLVEELVFRGMTFQIAYKIRHSFWIANTLQALAFGIGHMNLVQGCYAFCLGMVMGCVYRKYRSIYATMLLHAVFNFSGTILTGLFSLIPIANNMLFNIVVMLIALLGSYAGYIIIRNDKSGNSNLVNM